MCKQCFCVDKSLKWQIVAPSIGPTPGWLWLPEAGKASVSEGSQYVCPVFSALKRQIGRTEMFTAYHCWRHPCSWLFLHWASCEKCNPGVTQQAAVYYHSRLHTMAAQKQSEVVGTVFQQWQWWLWVTSAGEDFYKHDMQPVFHGWKKFKANDDDCVGKIMFLSENLIK